MKNKGIEYVAGMERVKVFPGTLCLYQDRQTKQVLVLIAMGYYDKKRGSEAKLKLYEINK